MRVPVNETLSRYTKGMNGKISSWFNPAIAQWRNKNLISFRCECYPYWNNGRSALGFLNCDFSPADPPAHWLSLPGRRAWEEAQDGRWIIFDDHLLLAYSTSHSLRMALIGEDFQVENVWNFQPDGFEFTPYEKNWGFFEANGKMWTQYTPSPHVVALVDGVTIRKTFHQEHLFPFPGTPRGGASPFLHEGKFWHFFHSSVDYETGIPDPIWDIKRRYHVGVQVFDAEPPFKLLTATTTPIMSGWHEDEVKDMDGFGPNHACIFPGSVHRNDAGDGWLVAAGVNDRSCFLFEVPDALIAAKLG